jgi:hypothetical protein
MDLYDLKDIRFLKFLKGNVYINLSNTIVYSISLVKIQISFTKLACSTISYECATFWKITINITF